MTPTTVGWVLAGGDDADGSMLAREEFAVQPGDGGIEAVTASEQAAAAVLRAHTMVETHGERLRGIGVTWSSDAAAEAALLVESLTDAGFDNVVPVRFDQAAGAETGAPLAVARGAALALDPAAEFNNLVGDLVGDAAPDQAPTPARSRPLSYTGALALLVAGVVGFVVSLSIALSLQLTPARESPPVHQVAQAPATPPVAQTAVPVAAPPPADNPKIPAEAPALDLTSSAPVAGETAAPPVEESPAPGE